MRNVRVEDVPVKMLRRFCRDQGYGIKNLHVMNKDAIVAAINSVDPRASEKTDAWLRIHEPNHKIESLDGGGRRITETYGDGTKRVYEEDAAGSFDVRFESPPRERKLRGEMDLPEYLRDLAARLMNVPARYGIDQEDCELLAEAAEYVEWKDSTSKFCPQCGHAYHSVDACQDSGCHCEAEARS